MSYKVGVIRGDGIGPEIVAEALKVLDKVAEKYNETFDYTDILLGGPSTITSYIFYLLPVQKTMYFH